MNTETFDAGEFTLERVREHVWEIPREGEMRVPARILASRPLLEQIAQDRTLEQLRNTTHLPGIQTHALCMPDGHQGYGFPVGGVAGIDAEDGCISPGAVGYDINCLPAETDVRLSFGRRIPIGELKDRFEDERAVVAGETLTASDIRLFTESDDKQVYEVETVTGERIEATEDHPFLTPDGMCELADLEAGETVLVQPFRGLEHEEPADVTVLTEDDFDGVDHQIRRVLTERDILPLSTSDEAFNHLLKILGFVTGDRSFGGEGQTRFDADPEDLETIRTDLKKIDWFETSEYSEYSDKTTARVLRLVLQKLGAPVGKKLTSGFETPWYFEHLTNWQKALYYSAYFGAEMSAPATQQDTSLCCPSVSQNRSVDTAAAGRRFFEDLTQFLADVGIETNSIEAFETDSDSETDVIRLRVGVKNDSENLIRFFSTVGYRYNRDKQQAAVAAIQYLKRNERERARQERVSTEATMLADGGISQGATTGNVTTGSFEAFCEACEVTKNLTVETEIAAIEPAGRKTVYDIGVAHEAHNFLADEFVVSNCGVRLLKTNLTYPDIVGHETELVEELFEAVPTGLGGGGVIKNAPVEKILEHGVEWAVEAGYGVESDLAHCEDEGFRPEADPSKVSQKAKDRGRNQVGSLGSGNHFLEVQRVTDIYDEHVASEFGLTPDQIVVLIHCGSRGLGHQVCTNYLRDIERSHQGLLNQLPDKELAAAPASSQLADDYYGAMCAAINFAWVNRQLIMHQTRRVFEEVFDQSWQAMEMELLYDVAHNIAKKEVHEVGVDEEGRSAIGSEAVDTEQRELYVHRKGATRAFPAGRPELPPAYRDVGQPVLIPGSMGVGSYVLRGGENSLSETFGSTAHGAGRLMSRTQAKREYWGEDVREDLRQQNQIYVKAESGATIAEEAPGVYKDVDEVVSVSDALGIGDRVARMYPVCNIKG